MTLIVPPARIVRAKGCLPDQAHKLLFKRRATLHPLIAATLAALPSSGDLSAYQPPILDQGPTGSCTAHSMAAAIYTAFAGAGAQLPFVPSQRLIYTPTREIARASTSFGADLPPLTDGGAQLADVGTAVGRYGISPMGPSVDGRNSDISSSNVNDEADLQGLESSGLKVVTGEYVAAPDSDVVAAAIAAKIPVWVGFFCDSAFEDLTPGQVAKAPNQSDPIGGGHAVYLSGYSGPKGRRVFTVTNSWGNWCDSGRCLVSESWLAATWGLYLMTIAGGAQ